ncbi:MarR family winged helix-turn-helix transcriptional regulator [uncultured Friedmanniella sp.]|uniref:MarR family winged helix-turn-helix transcriptional regulator n=1 Tax=uncultured Friedmanniella sp. TaxID=335381 RepID=UPI0035CBFDD4
MPSPDQPADDQPTRWLDPAERAVWLGLARLTTKLPSALDTQLERDADLNYFEYIVMAVLSEQGDRTLRMSQLAALTNASLSRLSHVAKRLESRGFLRREPDREDGRYTKAVLTDVGVAKVVESAPGHVTAVRELVIDALTPTQLSQLHEAVEAIVARVDPGNSSWPKPPAV